jgi:hypothetical protein
MSAKEWLGYVICDLDGCLSDDRHRRHLLPTSTPKNYDAYHAASVDDKAVSSVKSDIMYDLFDVDNQAALFLIVTGRPEEHRATTVEWLKRELPGVEFKALMRPSNDFTPAPKLKRDLLVEFFLDAPMFSPWQAVVSAYDDRADVLAAYPIPENRKHLVALPDFTRRTLEECMAIAADAITVPEILTAMAQTFRERNAVYGDNFKLVAPVMKALWPEGVPSALVTTDHWHLFELIVVKLTRLATSGISHIDSIHDIAVYAAMIEADLRRNA